jgi:hypothetical protein
MTTGLHVRASLICEDVRVELGGRLTAVGILGDVVRVGPGDGPIAIPKLVFLVIVGGLGGTPQIAFRHHLVGDVAAPADAPPLREERHDPASDEHSFVLVLAPMVFDAPGSHRLVVDVVAGAATLHHEHAFRVERDAVPTPAEGDRP